MNESISPDLKNALNIAEGEARRMSHACVDVPHLLLGILQADKTASFALAAFGVREGKLREAAREWSQTTGLGAPGDNPAGGLDLPLSARAARLLERYEAFAVGQDRGGLTAFGCLVVAISEEEFSATPLLSRLGVDVESMRLELRVMDGWDPPGAKVGGTPRLNDYHRSLYRGPLGLPRRLHAWWTRPRLRCVTPSPTDPEMLIQQMVDRAICADEDTFRITPADFPHWVKDEVRRLPGFDLGDAFARIRQTLPDNDRLWKWTGMVLDWPDPVTSRGGSVRACRAGDAIQLRVTRRWTHNLPPPDEDPLALSNEIVASVSQSGKRKATIRREQLTEYLERRTVQHPKFDAGACHDALVRLLDRPRGKLPFEGPIHWGTQKRGMWIYFDGETVRVSLRLGLIARIRLWRRHRLRT